MPCTHTLTHARTHTYPITDHEVSGNPDLDNVYVLYGVRYVHTDQGSTVLDSGAVADLEI